MSDEKPPQRKAPSRLEMMELKSLLAGKQAEMDSFDHAFMRIDLLPDASITACNDLFVGTMFWDPEEIKGQPETIMVPAHVRDSPEYQQTWETVRAGTPVRGRFERMGGEGAVRDLQGVYVPVQDRRGNIVRVAFYANDISKEEKAHRRREAERSAINLAFGIINFTPDGIVLGANPIFCEAMGYEPTEIKGKHHSIFTRPGESDTDAYKEFWADLAGGKSYSGDVRRVRKDGSAIWLKAVYAPVPARDGTIESIIKYATDISEQVILRRKVEALVSEARRVMGAVAEGNLNERVTGAYQNDLAQLAKDINGTCERLSDLTTRIMDTSEQITLRAQTVTDGNRTLAQRTEEQASFLRETATSMEEMTGTVRRNAENANTADKLASEASASATRGGEMVSRVIDAMRGINASSRKISDIIGVIDEIAFNTNLLALNAAVEAARAGEEGRGFAVVASEVRNLAQRSASAAKDIKALIEESLEKVDEGSSLVDDSGDTLEEIVEGVRKLSELIGDIATASSEQSAGIDQISTSITRMDKMTQQNAGLTEDAAVASDSARQQAEELKELVEFFRGGDGLHDTSNTTH